MGGATLVIALFFPPLWGHLWHIEGFVWQLRDLSPVESWSQAISRATYLDWLILFFPPCALTVCTIWLWSRQMSWNSALVRGGVVMIEASILGLLATAIFFVVIFIIPAPGNGWGVAFALFNTMWTGVAFLAFLPCLLIVALILAWLQKKRPHSKG
jgi:hypothetical protein